MTAFSARCLSLLLALTVLVPVTVSANAPTLERVSFSPSASRPGTVVRLHFTDRVGTFGMEEGRNDRLVRVTASGAVASASFACDELIQPFSDCRVVTEDGRLSVRLTLSGMVATADVYRDARVRSDLLVYVEAIAAPMAPATLATGMPAPGSGADPAAFLSERLARSAEELHIDTVVIDAGHGGHDPGTIGYGGLREKDIVLDVALRVGAYLEELAGVKVVYTRDDDRFIELSERGEIARRKGGKLFVSIHANWGRDARARGTETYFLGRNKTGAARSVIERENSVIELEDNREHYARFDAASLVKVRMTESVNLMQSQDLANRIQQQYRERVGRRDRKVKEGNFYVLWSAGMPAVLTEIGFISNPSEARFLASDQGKDFIASAIFRAVRDYKVAYEAELDVAAVR